MIIRAWAQHLAAIDAPPEAALRAAHRAVTDLVGVAAAGRATVAGEASLAAAAKIWGEGRASAWFAQGGLPTAGAAFVNATFAAALDLDDGHRHACGHPGASIIPAVLAIGEVLDQPVERVLTAIALGYEFGVRVAASRDIAGLRTTDTGQWCGYGVAAAAGWLRNVTVDVLANAMAIAGHTSSGQFATGSTALGHSVKEGIPWATANGLMAVDLALAGHRGPLDMLDDRRLYDRDRLLGGLDETSAITGAYFKRYSCCRWAHAAIDAALLIQEDHGLDPAGIRSIEVETFSRALSLPNQANPKSGEAAQYSVPFTVALALARGPGALLPLDERTLGDGDVLDLAGRITLKASRRFDAMFPAATPACVRITTASAILTREIVAPKGEPTAPLNDRDLNEKFERLAATSLGIASARALAVELACLRHQPSIAPLMRRLRSMTLPSQSDFDIPGARQA